MPENEEAENCNLEELDRSQEENMKSKVSLSEKLKKMFDEALAQHSSCKILQRTAETNTNGNFHKSGPQ
jgi:hypothetical protein